MKATKYDFFWKRSCAVLWILLISFQSWAGDINHFLAGVLLLNSNRVLSAEQKAQQFRKLQVITSTSGLEAKLYVEKFWNNPEEWKKVYESIADILSDCNNQRSIPDIKISDSNKSSPKE